MKNFAYGTHFQFHDNLKELIGIKSLNTKQCPPGFSPRIIPSSPNPTACIPPFTMRQQKELVLINHSWISLTLQWGWGLGFYKKKKK